MSKRLGWLVIHPAKWDGVGPESVWSAAATVFVASTLLALNRFGGLATTAPRPFVKLVLIGVWGWIGLALAVWTLGSLLAGARSQRGPPITTLIRTAAVVGLAHAPIMALTVVVFVAADVMQLLGPGMVSAVFVFVVWFPAWLLAGTRSALRISLPRATAVVAVSYGAWLQVVGRHLLGQIAHLL